MTANIDTEPTTPYKASEMNERIEKEIERLGSQALWGWDKESRNLSWFGLVDGMSILELGSGPGFVTEQLIALCPNSHITCVEIDRDLILHAEQYLQSKRLESHYTIIQGDLMTMDMPDNIFDFAVARLVFQHLRDPRGALAEILRVLKPGGKLVIHDIDIGLGEIVDPQNTAAEAIEGRLHESRSERGGNPRIGRQLWRLMAATGYENMDLEVVPVHTDKMGIEAIFPDEWDAGAFKPALDLGAITDADVEILHEAHQAFQASPDKYALFVSLMVCGQKVPRQK
ncbi:MAG: methyltransferase domain-containing protein [Chloroflexota bacterium]